MARKEVMGDRLFDPEAPWYEDYNDDMGEAVLALLEGRDMGEALHEFRRKEFPYRHINRHMDDFRGDDNESWFDQALPPSSSAEEEFFTAAVKEPTMVKPAWNPRGYRYHDVHTRNRGMKHKTQGPSRRRQRDAGWKKYAA